MVEKRTVSVQAVTVHIYTIAIVVLVAALLLLGLKYLHLKLAMNHYMLSEIWQQTNQPPVGNITDYGVILAVTLGQYPQATPLYTQPLQLENYVVTLSKTLRRDIVVLDTHKKILADTVVGNMGSTYSSDNGNEINKTLQDGLTRSFTEKSTDYPSGLSEVVVPMKNDKAMIVGAVLISNSTISQ